MEPGTVHPDRDQLATGLLAACRRGRRAVQGPAAAGRRAGRGRRLRDVLVHGPGLRVASRVRRPGRDGRLRRLRAARAAAATTGCSRSPGRGPRPRSSTLLTQLRGRQPTTGGHRRPRVRRRRLPPTRRSCCRLRRRTVGRADPVRHHHARPAPGVPRPGPRAASSPRPSRPWRPSCPAGLLDADQFTFLGSRLDRRARRTRRRSSCARPARPGPSPTRPWSTGTARSSIADARQRGVVPRRVPPASLPEEVAATGALVREPPTGDPMAELVRVQRLAVALAAAKAASTPTGRATSADR